MAWSVGGTLGGSNSTSASQRQAISIACFIDARAEIEGDARIEPFTVIEGACKVARGAVIGPFARLRGETQIGQEARIGNFVEVVRTQVGEGSRALHLSYLGDGELGQDVNVGAGTAAETLPADNQPPDVVFRTAPAAVAGGIKGTAPLEVRFNMCRSVDPEGDKLYWTMDLDGDGKLDVRGSTGASCREPHTYAAGTWFAEICCTEALGFADFCTASRTAGFFRWAREMVPVAVPDPTIFTGRSVYFLASSRGQSRTAAPPSLTGEQFRRRSGSATMDDCMTSSTEMSRGNWALGFLAPCWWFFTETHAMSSSVVPKASMWARAIMA